jgi:hypothetical protein
VSNPNELPDPGNPCEVCATHGSECLECRAERYKANQIKDPDCVSHCGCGVPFTEDCDGCKEYLGDQYHSPNEPTRPEWKGAPS